MDADMRPTLDNGCELDVAMWIDSDTPRLISDALLLHIMTCRCSYGSRKEPRGISVSWNMVNDCICKYVASISDLKLQNS